MLSQERGGYLEDFDEIEVGSRGNLAQFKLLLFIMFLKLIIVYSGQ